MIKGNKQKRRQGNQPTGAYPLVPIGLEALGEVCLIPGLDLHTASLSAQKSGCERKKRRKETQKKKKSQIIQQIAAIEIEMARTWGQKRKRII